MCAVAMLFKPRPVKHFCAVSNLPVTRSPSPRKEVHQNLHPALFTASVPYFRMLIAIETQRRSGVEACSGRQSLQQRVCSADVTG